MGNSILDVDTDSVPELRPVAGDQEVRVRIVSFRSDDKDNIIREDRNGNPFILPIYEILEEPNAPEFSDYIGIGDTDEKKDNSKKRRLKNWKICFGIENGDLEDYIGNEGWIITKLEESTEYGPQNGVKRYMAGK